MPGRAGEGHLCRRRNRQFPSCRYAKEASADSTDRQHSRRDSHLVPGENLRRQIMRKAIVLTAWFACALHAQNGQQGSRPGWPCVAGRAVDPAYLEVSESTGGQLFLFQPGELEHAAMVMSAPQTHPATMVRAVGHLSGTREIEFPVDSTARSILVMASLQ